MHETTCIKEYFTGAEEWLCLKCSRHVIVQWIPFKRIMLFAGDEFAKHSVSRGGLRVNTFLSRLLLRRLTDGIITFSQQARTKLIHDFGIAPERVVRVIPALDTAKSHPGAGNRAFRAELGFTDSDIVVGVVARFQKYRKMDTFFEAMRLVIQQNPRVKAMLVGRSSQMEETIRRPIQELGLTQNVVLAGYLTDRYLDGLASMDMFVFMIAGSDGTARALREALAMSVPVIANQRLARGQDLKLILAGLAPASRPARGGIPPRAPKLRDAADSLFDLQP